MGIGTGHHPNSHKNAIKIYHHSDRIKNLWRVPSEDRDKQLRINCEEIRIGLKEAMGDHNIIDGFAPWLAPRDYPFFLIEDIRNRIIIKYKTGGMDLLPKGIRGEQQLRDFLGVKYDSITHWFPIPLASNSPQICTYTYGLR